MSSIHRGTNTVMESWNDWKLRRCPRFQQKLRAQMPDVWLQNTSPACLLLLNECSFRDNNFFGASGQNNRPPNRFSLDTREQSLQRQQLRTSKIEPMCFRMYDWLRQKSACANRSDNQYLTLHWNQKVYRSGIFQPITIGGNLSREGKLGQQ